ncbi:MAG TPA: OmpA family protein [Gemmatimonadota bacterium]|nr:OmpA family protein [Gemmatimonadota bacterium]
MHGRAPLVLAVGVAAATALLAPRPATAQSAAPSTAKTYPDGHGGKVTFPAGDVSFADSVVSFDTGDPPPVKNARHASEVLGAPDYVTSKDTGYVSLGCGGSITLQFVDNALFDVKGPDLFVFEIGPAVEPTDLAISRGGKHWTKVGKIEGGRADVDIGPEVEPGETFRYVRLTDLKSDCGGDWPGADLDAVGAIGTGRRFTLSSSVLFGVDSAQLKPAAKSALSAVADSLRGMGTGTVRIVGYTDATGTTAHNRALSRRRAESVRDYLKGAADLSGYDLVVVGAGESEPIAGNGTPEVRAKNRRVEITFVGDGG